MCLVRFDFVLQAESATLSKKEMNILYLTSYFASLQHVLGSITFNSLQDQLTKKVAYKALETTSCITQVLSYHSRAMYSDFCVTVINDNCGEILFSI